MFYKLSEIGESKGALQASWQRLGMLFAVRVR
jgi:hypothetical protein